MKWKGRRSSGNVTRRGSSSGGGRRRRGGGGFFPPIIPIGGGGGGLLILLLILFLIFGNPFSGGNTTEQPYEEGGEAPYSMTAEEREMEEFLAVVLADTEDYWNEIFAAYGKDYKEPQLVFYRDSTESGCGRADSNMGPFYCPADESVYIDVTFYQTLRKQFGASGDFTMAYVLAHEIGHHVQNQLGITDQVFKLQRRLPEKEFNKYMVRMELQADYFAGVFAHYSEDNGYLEVGDIEEAMNAAASIGDDRIQEKTLGRVFPDKFTHGTSEQRVRWFTRGYEYGDLDHGDTFSAESL